MAHILQDRYSPLVDAKLRASLVTRELFNTKYEGQPTAGAVKIPVRDTEVAVGDYNKATGGSINGGATSYLTVTIDKDKYVNEIIDGYDAAGVPDNIVADRIESAGYSLALTIDSDAIDTLVSEGTTLASTVALTNDTAYDSFVDTRKQARINKLPMEGLWAIVSPDTYALLLKSPEFIRASQLGDAVVQTGAVGKIAGMTVYESNNVPAGVEYIVGHKDWCHRIDEWQVPVVLKDLNNEFIGASAVQGRKIYKHKVSKANAVLVKTAV